MGVGCGMWGVECGVWGGSEGWVEAKGIHKQHHTEVTTP
jgi:hypothetical protein